MTDAASLASIREKLPPRLRQTLDDVLLANPLPPADGVSLLDAVTRRRMGLGVAIGRGAAPTEDESASYDDLVQLERLLVAEVGPRQGSGDDLRPTQSSHEAAMPTGLSRLGGWALAYFGIVFGAGFVFGPLRVLFLEPRLGGRLAQLIEAPLMLLVIVLGARWIARRVRGVANGPSARLVVGLLTAALVLAADLGVGLWLRGMTVAEVLAGRDPVSGAVYYALVALTALLPWLLGRGQD